MKKFLKGDIGLLLTVMLWGVSFIMSDRVLEKMGALQLMLYRFSIAGFVLVVISLFRRKRPRARTLVNGTILGVILFAAFWMQTTGLALSTPAKNAFLTGAYVIFVPFMSYFFYGRKTAGQHIVAVLITLAGAAVLSLENDLSVNFGDILTLVSALFYALHILFVSEFSKKDDVMLLTVIQIVVVAILCFFAAALTGQLSLEPLGEDTLPPIVFLALVCTALCFFLQVYFQKFIPETRASVIFSMEGPFSALFSVLLAIEPLTPKLAVGCGLMFFAVIFSSVKRYSFFK